LLYLSSRYDPTSVATSVFIAMFASYVALDLAKRVRSTDRLLAIGWLLGGSATMGTGIWSMHFVGMLAFRLPIEVGYSYATTGQAPPTTPIVPAKRKPPAKKATPATAQPATNGKTDVAIPTPEDAAIRYADPTKR